MAVDSAGNVYVADRSQSRVLKVTPDGRVSTVAGTGNAESAGDGGPATSASVNSPTALAVDAAGNLFIAEGHGSIRRVAPDGRITSVSIVAPGVEQISPTALALAPDGSIVFATTREVLRVRPDGSLAPVAGSATRGFGGDDGPATSAKLDSPGALAVADDGSVYIADTTNNRVRKVGLHGTIVTVAGTGDGGPALAAQMDGVVALARDGQGNLYVCDSGNKRVRKITPGGAITTVA